MNWTLVGVRLIQSLPETMLIVLARLFARLASISFPKRRRIMEQNLKLALGENLPLERKSEIIFRSWHNLISVALCMIRFPKRKEYYLSQYTANNVKTIEKSLEKGRGVIILAPHLGNIFLGAASLAQTLPITVMVRHSRKESIRQVEKTLFDAMGFKTIERVGGLRGALTALKKNSVLIIALDQSAGNQGVMVDFFGQPASTAVFPASIALRKDIPVHIGYSLRLSDGRNEGWISEPVPLIHTEDPERAAAVNTQNFSKRIENIIRNNPDTWMWMHRRWKTPDTLTRRNNNHNI